MGEVYLEDYRCVSNGGMLVRTLSGGIQQNYNQLRFNDCKGLLHNGQQLDGDIDRNWTPIKYAYNPAGDTHSSFSPMTITTEEGRTHTLSGGLSWRGGSLSTVQWDNIGEEPFEFSAQSFEGATKVTEITLVRKSVATTASDTEPWVMSMLASFAVLAPQTGNKPIRVDTLDLFDSHCQLTKIPSRRQLIVNALDCILSTTSNCLSC